MNLYEGPFRWWQSQHPDYVSREWCAGQVQSIQRRPEYPLPTPYSRQVMRRILDGRSPVRSLATILELKRA